MEQQITLETLHQRMDSLQELLMNVLDLLSKEKKKQLKEKEEKDDMMSIGCYLLMTDAEVKDMALLL